MTFWNVRYVCNMILNTLVKLWRILNRTGFDSRKVIILSYSLLLDASFHARSFCPPFVFGMIVLDLSSFCGPHLLANFLTLVVSSLVVADHVGVLVLLGQHRGLGCRFWGACRGMKVHSGVEVKRMGWVCRLCCFCVRHAPSDVCRVGLRWLVMRHISAL